jgi:hypothetical protein
MGAAIPHEKRDILRLGVSSAALLHHFARRSRGSSFVRQLHPIMVRDGDPIGTKVEMKPRHDAPQWRASMSLIRILLHSHVKISRAAARVE